MIENLTFKKILLTNIIQLSICFKRFIFFNLKKMIVNIFDFTGKKIQTVSLPSFLPSFLPKAEKKSENGKKGGFDLNDIFEKSDTEDKFIPLFPEDDISDLKEKIFLATGILPCEQFLFLSDENSSNIGHNIFIEDIPFEIELPFSSAQSAEEKEEIHGIKIDRKLYNAKNLVRIEDEEYIKIDFTEINVLSLASLEIKISQEDYEIVYWSLVKYFPYFDFESFKDYIRKNFDRFPNLFPDKYALIQKFTSEIATLEKVHNFERDHPEYFDILQGIENNKSRIVFKITKITILVQKRGVPDLQNIFTLMPSCEEIPIIIFHNRGTTYTKVYNGAYHKLVPHLKKIVLIFVTAAGPTYEITRDGSIFITFEQPIKNFIEVKKMIKEHIGLLHKKLNSLELSLFKNDPVIDHFEIINLESTLSYIFTYDVLEYTRFVQKLRESRLAQVTSRIDGNQYYWIKGTKETFLESANQFNYKQSNTFAHLPFNTFEIMNKFSQIDVFIKNISEEDFNNLFKFMAYFFYQIPVATAQTNVNNLKLLRTLDPANYNDKSKNAPVFSRYCQKPMQPKPVQNTEGLARDRLLNFWNYTRGEPMTYYCPNNKYPYPGFAVGYHPEGNCSVCCRKKKELEDSKIYTSCIKNHYFHTEETNQPVSYIIHYGKFVEPGRLGVLPDLLNKFLIYNLEDINVISESHTLRIFKYNGKIYSLDRLKKYTETSKVQQIPVSVLSDFLRQPVWRRKRKGKELIKPADVLANPHKNTKFHKHYNRIINASEEPILIYFDNRAGRFVILDGNHRLANAFRLKKKTITAKMISKKQLLRCLIGKYKTDDITFATEVVSVESKTGGAFVEKEPFYYILGVLTFSSPLSSPQCGEGGKGGEKGNNISYLSSFAAIHNQTIEDFLKTTLKKINTFEFFGNYSVAEIKKIILAFLSQKTAEIEKDREREVFYGTLHLIYDIIPIILDYDGKNVQLIMQSKYKTLSPENKFVLLLRVKNVYNPIVIAIPYAFGKTLEIETRIFDYDNILIKMLIKMAQDKNEQKLFSLERIMEMVEIKRVLNYQGQAFAVEALYAEKLIYIAIEQMRVEEVDYKIKLGEYDLEASLAFVQEYAKKFGFALDIDKIYYSSLHFAFGKTIDEKGGKQKKEKLFAYRVNDFINFVTPSSSSFLQSEKEKGEKEKKDDLPEILRDLKSETIYYDPEAILNAKTTSEDPMLSKYLELEAHRNDYIFYKEEKLKPYFSNTSFSSPSPQSSEESNCISKEDEKKLISSLKDEKTDFSMALIQELKNPLKKKLYCNGIYNFKKLYLYKHKNEQIFVLN